jgi:hypothetical protein
MKKGVGIISSFGYFNQKKLGPEFSKKETPTILKIS